MVLGVQVRQDGEGGTAVGERWEGVCDVQEAGGSLRGTQTWVVAGLFRGGEQCGLGVVLLSVAPTGQGGSYLLLNLCGMS